MTFGKYLFFRIVKAENDTVFEISVGDSKGHTVWPIQYGLYLGVEILQLINMEKG